MAVGGRIADGCRRVADCARLNSGDTIPIQLENVLWRRIVEAVNARGTVMRMLMKVNIPVEAGNKAIREGTLGKTMQQILQAQRPEAAYFVAENGQRCGYLIINLDQASKIPALAEPWFLAFNAAVELQPLMTPEDLQQASRDIESCAKIYGQEPVAV